jgi:hypothetical protein
MAGASAITCLLEQSSFCREILNRMDGELCFEDFENDFGRSLRGLTAAEARGMGWACLGTDASLPRSHDWAWPALICHITGFARLFLR